MPASDLQAEKQNGIVLPLKPYDIECIHAVYQILCKDCTVRITIQGLAVEVGINRNKLHYGFRQVFGQTIHDFVKQQRMERARSLLITTHKSVKTIAALTGYKSSSAFDDAFRKKYGITPLQYRKQGRMQYRHPPAQSEDRDTFCENADILV